MAGGTPYDERLYDLDLCILSYQLYAQTLLWPMDPYSEQMARPWTSRRDAFLARARRRFAERRVPGHLDPILTDLRRLGPLRPCFMKPERLGTWEVFDAPSAIADRIGEVWVATERSSEPVLLWRAPGGTAGRPDRLYAFEGRTGQVWRRHGHGSFLGFVLERDLGDAGNRGPGDADGDDAGGYDVHVVFRGSRSGWVVRSAMRGLVAGQGNPDWTTAMDLFRQVPEPRISATGRSSRGFGRSVNETLPNIATCLDAIDWPHPPRSIHVSGHSLGGALAAHFTAAMVLAAPEGSARARPAGAGGWRSWPWDNVVLRTYGAPTVGDAAFRASLELSVSADRFWVAGDPVVTNRVERFGVHVGHEHPLPPPAALRPKPRPWHRDGAEPKPRVQQQFHKPQVLRQALVEQLEAEGADLAAVPATAPAAPDAPWKSYPSLGAVLAEHPRFHRQPANLEAALRGIGAQLVTYLELAEWVLGRRRAYPFHLKTARQRRLASGAVRQVIETIRAIEDDPRDTAASERVWMRITDAVNDVVFHRYLGQCLILAHLAKVPDLRPKAFGTMAVCLDEF